MTAKEACKKTSRPKGFFIFAGFVYKTVGMGKMVF